MRVPGESAERPAGTDVDGRGLPRRTGRQRLLLPQPPAPARQRLLVSPFYRVFFLTFLVFLLVLYRDDRRGFHGRI